MLNEVKHLGLYQVLYHIVGVRFFAVLRMTNRQVTNLPT
jgi:hypothetical protein